jgi:hypothetical protein
MTKAVIVTVYARAVAFFFRATHFMDHLRTSLHPWTSRHDTYFTFILDANGERIGKFNDHRDADLVIELQAEIERLKEEVINLNDKLDEELEEKDIVIYELETKLEEAQQKL